MPEQWILKGERDECYSLYIEAYALDYIQKKENSSELFLYGTRQPGVRERLLVYGVSGAMSDGGLFAPYEMITGLHVREAYGKETKTIAFEMERKQGEIHRIKGYYVFYEENPVMKQWLVREHGYAPKPVLEACETLPVPHKKRNRPYQKSAAERAVDMGLIAILLTLLSVVIDTLNSPLKISRFVEHLQQIQKMLKR